jgi:phosphatidylserine/phosphatidylglycerophosphate/cardiolipin synthase-like enzyme
MLSFFRGQKIKIKRVNSSKILHAKIIIIDQKYLFLGSHNLTQNAFELSHEISIGIEDQEAINRCNNFFDNLCLL